MSVTRLVTCTPLMEKWRPSCLTSPLRRRGLEHLDALLEPARRARGTARRATVNSSSSQPKPRPNDEPALGQLLHRARRAGDRQGVAEGEDEDPGGELDPRRDGGGGAELHERVDQLGVRADDRPGVVVLVGLASVGCARGVPDREHDVLAEPQRREPRLVGGRRQLEELGGVHVVGGEADLHAGLLSQRMMPRARRSAIGVVVEPLAAEHVVGVGAEGGRPPEGGRHAVELGRGRHQHDLPVALVLDALHVAVGQRLRVVLHLAGGEQRRPTGRPAWRGSPPTRRGSSRRTAPRAGDQRLAVRLAVGRVGEALVGEPVELIDGDAELGPVAVRLEERQAMKWSSLVR